MAPVEIHIQTLAQLGAQTMEIAQAALLPILGVCFVVSIVFFVMQMTFSFTDFSLQFLVKLVLVVGVGVFMAKSFSDRYLEFAKAVFAAAPEMVR